MSYLPLNRFPLIFTTADIAYAAKPKAARIEFFGPCKYETKAESRTLWSKGRTYSQSALVLLEPME
jgi:hypothetical protein